MVCLIHSKARLFVSATTPFNRLHFSDLTNNPLCSFSRKWFRSKAMRLNDVEDIQLGSSSSPNISRTPLASIGLQQVTGSKLQNVNNSGGGIELFDELKQRFLSFKKHKYLQELDHFQTLKEVQSPKFMVIACADSRVCPSTILGFLPGEAFMIRNVANLVPPLENGPSETNAALEFAVKTLQVENILIIGHSRCGGIQTLMSMKDNEDSSFINNWVANGKIAKLRTEAAPSHLSFNQLCRLCEKESINRSLMNLLTYPWIKDRVRKELLFVHGGYYDFLNCTFEKWTLDFKESNAEVKENFLVKDQEFWC